MTLTQLYLQALPIYFNTQIGDSTYKSPHNLYFLLALVPIPDSYSHLLCTISPPTRLFFLLTFAQSCETCGINGASHNRNRQEGKRNPY